MAKNYPMEYITPMSIKEAEKMIDTTCGYCNNIIRLAKEHKMQVLINKENFSAIGICPKEK